MTIPDVTEAERLLNEAEAKTPAVGLTTPVTLRWLPGISPSFTRTWTPKPPTFWVCCTTSGGEKVSLKCVTVWTVIVF